MRIGSQAHKELFCQSFIASHRPYEPAHLPWPHLDSVALERLRGIPFWEEALDTERHAGRMVTAFAETVSDPVLREAIALQGLEETRHGQLLEYMIGHYGIEVKERPAKPRPKNMQQAFIDFGFDECLDSFFAFGMFGLAREAQYFPEPLFTIFDALVEEEARHIVFFVNWVSYLQVQQGLGAPPLRAVQALWQYAKSLRHLVAAFNGASDGSGEGFTASGARTFLDDLTLEGFLAKTIAENDRRMAAYDPRLLQPRLMPRLAGTALRLVRLLPKKGGNQGSPALN